MEIAPDPEPFQPEAEAFTEPHRTLRRLERQQQDADGYCRKQPPVNNPSQLLYLFPLFYRAASASPEPAPSFVLNILMQLL